MPAMVDRPGRWTRRVTVLYITQSHSLLTQSCIKEDFLEISLGALVALKQVLAVSPVVKVLILYLQDATHLRHIRQRAA